MAAIDKPLVWLRGEVKTPPFSQAARVEAGVLLRQLQGGAKLGLPHSRLMPGIGAHCHKLRIVDEGVTWRIIYRLETSKSGANMDKRKRARLRAAGWTVGTPREFLRLSDEEAAFVEFKLALSRRLQALRAAQELSQAEVARRLQSSQSRVAKMEASDPTVSVDLLVRSLFRLGAQPGDIAKALRPRRRVAAT